MKKIILLALTVSLAIGSFAGCQNTPGQNADNATENSKTDSSYNSVDNSIKEVIGEPAKSDNAEAVKGTGDGQLKVSLYFHNKEAMNVVKEERSISSEGNKPGTAEMAKICLEELVKGSNGGLSTSIPKSTKIRSVKLDGGSLVVDLSQDFEKDSIGGSAGVIMTMSQLVLTLTELEGVKQVSFKIEGRTRETFKGEIEFGKPFTRKDYEQYIVK